MPGPDWYRVAYPERGTTELKGTKQSNSENHINQSKSLCSWLEDIQGTRGHGSQHDCFPEGELSMDTPQAVLAQLPKAHTPPFTFDVHPPTTQKLRKSIENRVLSNTEMPRHIIMP
jgi:hypothetical protein